MDDIKIMHTVGGMATAGFRATDRTSASSQIGPHLRPRFLRDDSLATVQVRVFFASWKVIFDTDIGTRPADAGKLGRVAVTYPVIDIVLHGRLFCEYLQHG